MSDVYLIKKETLTAIADTIREKSKSTENIKVSDMVTHINSLGVSYSEVENEFGGLTISIGIGGE